MKVEFPFILVALGQELTKDNNGLSVSVNSNLSKLISHFIESLCFIFL